MDWDQLDWTEGDPGGMESADNVNDITQLLQT